MFQLDKGNMAITMHRGDTGAFYVNLSRSSGNEFTEDDRMMFKIRSGERVVMDRYYKLAEEETENGRVLVAFRNSDTDMLPAGTYNTEIRVAIDPVWLDGEIVDGSTVRTVVQSTLTIIDVIKEV